MRRRGHLFEQVTDFANLLHAYTKARRGSGWCDQTRRFFFALEPELLTLQKEPVLARYVPGAYRHFRIIDPKPRLISVAPFRDRVVHHAVVAVLTPVYEPVFIHDSYATRLGKGTHRAVLRARAFCRRDPWFLKMDVAAYFASVDHGVLMELLQRRIKDRRLLDLLALILANGGSKGRGLPIGNLTSQFLANVYLDPLDHLVKDRWGVKGYLRYMDDFVLFGADPITLDQRREAIESFLAERLKLRAKPRATSLNRSGHGLTFLGRRVFPRYLRLTAEGRRRNLRRQRACIRAWENAYIDDDTLARRLASLLGHRDAFLPQPS
jgi:RNA-directed DNA polymerase